MRRSFCSSAGWLGSVHASRRPLALVSSTKGDHPCERPASPVLSSIRVSIHPATGAPLVHSRSCASNCRWCELKQVSTKEYFIVFGSSTATWRFVRSVGKSFADGWSEPFLQKSGLFFGSRTVAASHTRPSRPNIALWLLALVSQIFSSPQ